MVSAETQQLGWRKPINQAPTELRDEGDEGGTRGTRWLERKKMRKKKEERREAEERERERKKRENICLVREDREVNN